MKQDTANVMVLLGKIAAPVGKVTIKLLKTAKVVKTALIGASLVSYAFMFTWQFAIFLMIFLFVHEYGHVWAMKRRGIHTKGMYFIPFVGAAAIADKDLGSCKDEIIVAIMGPIWGIVLALGFCGAYAISNITMFAGAAIFMFLITLFNLLPIMPLDGGRILRCIGVSIHSWGGVVVFLIGVAAAVLFMKHLSGLIFLFLIIGGLEVFGEMFWRIRGNKRIETIENTLRQMGIITKIDPKTGYIDIESVDETKTGAVLEEMLRRADHETDFDLTDFMRYKEAYFKDVRKLIIDLNFFRKKTRVLLTRRELVTSLAGFVVVATISLGTMIYMKNIPGADMALQVLEHKESHK